MIFKGECLCPICSGGLKYYDKVGRIKKGKDGAKEKIFVKRYRCLSCGKIHRELPDDILPFKQYDRDIIEGVREGLITSDTLGFEDYPCEQTLKLWKK